MTSGQCSNSAPTVQDFSKQDRQHLAAKSRSHIPTFGSTDRQQLSKELHDRMLAREVRSQSTGSSSSGCLMLYQASTKILLS